MSEQPSGQTQPKPQQRERGLLGSSTMELLIMIVFMATMVVFGYYVGQLVGTTTFSTMSQTSGGLAITSTLLKSMGFSTAAEVYNGTAMQAFAQANTAISADEMAFSGMMGLLGAVIGITYFVSRHRE